MYKIVLIFIFLNCLKLAQAQDSIIVISNSLNFTFDTYSNVNGGKKTGTVYRSLIQIGTEIKSNYIKNTLVNFQIAKANGQSPTNYLIGDLQTISNIDSDVSLFLYELYVRYKKMRTMLKIGIHNLNEDFVLCRNSSDLINSSFGIPSLITVNSFASVYPKTTLGVSFTKDFSLIKFKSALFDGFPINYFKNDLAWGIHLYDGFVHVLELEKSIKKISFLMGTYTHSGSLNVNKNNFKLNSHSFLYTLICGEFDSLKQYFIQYAHSLTPLQHHFYVGGGIRMGYNVYRFSCFANLGIAYAANKDYSKNEIAIELSNAIEISEQFKLMPDIQYIINPSGSDRHLKNGFLINLRCQLLM